MLFLIIAALPLIISIARGSHIAATLLLTIIGLFFPPLLLVALVLSLATSRDKKRTNKQLAKLLNESKKEAAQRAAFMDKYEADNEKQQAFNQQQAAAWYKPYESLKDLK